MIMTPGEHIHGRYRLIEALGSGGMATVWRAHDERLDRVVALKCLKAPLSEDPEFLVRFFAEAQAIARLSHPNVVRVLDFGDGDDAPFLVMEYVPGGSLADRTGSPVEAGRAVDLISGAARGAGAVHAAGLVHRDLKPANILLSDTSLPKIGDFGIAVGEAQERLTATGTAIGSPHYVSPEQASGREIGPPSDVYSLGVVLYELVTGGRPFEGDNATALAIAHVEESPVPPSTHIPGIRPELDEAIIRCLAKDPDERFKNGDELAAALDAIALDRSTPPMAVVTSAMPDEGEEDDENEASGKGKRGRAFAIVGTVLAAALVVGAVALSGPKGEDTAIARGEQGASVNHNEPLSPSTSADSNEEPVAAPEPVTTSSSPTVSPSPNPTDPSESRVTRARTRGGDDDDEETTTEPTSEPTSEPTTQPTSTP